MLGVGYDRDSMSAGAEAKPKGGLEDVVATSSSICFIDGDRGILAYRGYDIHDLAPKATFEEVCYLLWHGRLPNRAELGELQSQFAAARPLPDGVIRLMRQMPPSEAMDTLRTLASALGALRSRRGRPVAGRELPQGRAADGADRKPRRRDRPGRSRTASRSIPIRCWGMRRTSSTC